MILPCGVPGRGNRMTAAAIIRSLLSLTAVDELLPKGNR